jgi:hypothetical protein
MTGEVGRMKEVGERKKERGKIRCRRKLDHKQEIKNLSAPCFSVVNPFYSAPATPSVRWSPGFLHRFGYSFIKNIDNILTKH